MNKKRNILFVIAITSILFVGSALFHLTSYEEPMPEALIAMKSDAVVEVTDADSIVFTPINTKADTALIIYPASDLSRSAMPVMSIYGTNDGLTQPGKISKTRHLLPDSVFWISIRGANHSQFGWYGFQKGDEKADISREAQQMEIVEATMGIIEPNEWENIKTGD